ncbi:MAG: hypothetical protein Q8R82_20075 [Hyphomonadaceae bacterium]|nr:hypothetical protein [Hyphomonadaceae bacterium]
MITSVLGIGVLAFAASLLTGPVGLGVAAAFVIGARIGLPDA